MADGTTHPSSATIGPITEARIREAFADRAVLTGKDTARLIGMDVKTLDAITDAGAIRAVRRGAGETRGYTEGDIRAYLTESAAPCRTKSPARVSQPVAGKVVSFVERRRMKKR
ncbi:MAG: hypothetical protein Q8S03_10355 [Brevundimonas sp.]|uniref:hypothetical protein n=1 Tax=Brevundimonas sp. TaxID=1871086 RepID=UPI002736D1AE|nr:hypothetical protein [Brevundimonas sp.]MDP3405081.1 hypothetical protein [Brevundimonas sp.]